MYLKVIPSACSCWRIIRGKTVHREGSHSSGIVARNSERWPMYRFLFIMTGIRMTRIKRRKFVQKLGCDRIANGELKRSAAYSIEGNAAPTKTDARKFNVFETIEPFISRYRLGEVCSQLRRSEFSYVHEKCDAFSAVTRIKFETNFGELK